MFVKSIIGGIVLITLVTPALAADQYWVEYDYSTHQCSIVVKTVDDTAAETTNDTAVADTPQDHNWRPGWHATPNDSAAADMPQDGTANGMPTWAPIVVGGLPKPRPTPQRVRLRPTLQTVPQRTQPRRPAQRTRPPRTVPMTPRRTPSKLLGRERRPPPRPPGRRTSQRL